MSQPTTAEKDWTGRVWCLVCGTSTEKPHADANECIIKLRVSVEARLEWLERKVELE